MNVATPISSQGQLMDLGLIRLTARCLRDVIASLDKIHVPSFPGHHVYMCQNFI